MSRLLTLLLLYRSGYFVGKYISLERLIADSKETYYEVLQDSSTGWHEGTNDYLPFVRYMLGIPKVKELSAEYARILTEKKQAYAEYRMIKEEAQELVIAKMNIDSLYEAEKAEEQRIRQKEITH